MHYKFCCNFITFYLDILTTCLTAVKPFPIPPSRDHPIIEIAELYPDSQPQTAYINHMYVYPLSLAFDAQKNFPRARNITCMVQVFNSDEANSKPIKVILYQIYLLYNLLVYFY